MSTFDIPGRFVACQQARLLFVGGDGKAAAASDDLDFLMSVADLSNDVVEGVRIGVARFAIVIYGVLESVQNV
jgi:serine/threonine-protein phosphatase 4 regulatory subunit 1